MKASLCHSVSPYLPLVWPTTRGLKAALVRYHINMTFVFIPCPVSTMQSCPFGMVASRNATGFPTSASYYFDNGDGTGGFTDVLACVTQDGYGVGGRGAQPCDQGKYNRKDTYRCVRGHDAAAAHCLKIQAAWSGHMLMLSGCEVLSCSQLMLHISQASHKRLKAVVGRMPTSMHDPA